MDKRYATIGFLGVGFVVLLMVLGGPLYAQVPGPSSAPPGERTLAPSARTPLLDTLPEAVLESSAPAAGVAEETVEPSVETPLLDTIPITALESSAPILPDGSVPDPERGPMPEETEIELDASLAATIADFRVAGSTLRPRGSDVDYIMGGQGGCIYASAGSAARIFNTGVYLPQGSNVLALRMYYNDTSAVDSRGWFTVYNLYGDIVNEWAVSSVGDTGRGFNDTVTISHTIDYLSYSYVLNWRPNDLGSDMQLCGFRIYYEPPPFGATFLPLVLRR